MTSQIHELTIRDADSEAFAPFGTFIEPPCAPEKRQFFSEHLHRRPETSAPVFHVNWVPASTMPLICNGVERHPYAAQCFVPLDVARYVVLVMPSQGDGNPLPQQSLAFMVPGNLGVIYHPQTWHMGATVLDRPGHFAVLMWRGGALPDDEFRRISPIRLMP